MTGGRRTAVGLAEPARPLTARVGGYCSTACRDGCQNPSGWSEHVPSDPFDAHFGTTAVLGFANTRCRAGLYDRPRRVGLGVLACSACHASTGADGPGGTASRDRVRHRLGKRGFKGARPTRDLDGRVHRRPLTRRRHRSRLRARHAAQSAPSRRGRFCAPDTAIVLSIGAREWPVNPWWASRLIDESLTGNRSNGR